MLKYLTVYAALAAVLMIGCGKAETEPAKDNKGDAAASLNGDSMTNVAYYCGSCGHGADANHTCDANCEKCDCGLHKGSDMCCKVPEEMKGKDICACGYAKGSENCCQDGAEKCSKCHMIKGSDMCCKIPHDHHHGDEGHGHDSDSGH